MDHERFLGEMKRLAASFRVELSAPTIAAYWTQLHGADERAFCEACARAIQSQRAFPVVADLTRLMLRVAEEWKTYAPQYALGAGEGTVACLTCMDAGYVRRDVALTHPDFGRAILCPNCNGTSNRRGNEHTEYMAFLARDQQERARLAPYRERQEAERTARRSPAQDSEIGAHSRWSPPMKVTR